MVSGVEIFYSSIKCNGSVIFTEGEIGNRGVYPSLILTATYSRYI
jgi:hypothetical protein